MAEALEKAAAHGSSRRPPSAFRHPKNVYDRRSGREIPALTNSSPWNVARTLCRAL